MAPIAEERDYFQKGKYWCG